jgi:tetratricopeptide (TPR) repeat protein
MKTIAFVAMLLVGFTLHVFAIPMFVEVEKVPTGRLITNLTKRVQAYPKDPELHYALARVHCWAYAQGQTEFDVKKKDGTLFLGYFDAGQLPPRTVNVESDTVAKQHLTNAIDYYQKAVTLNSNHWAAQLGLAWCLDQSGDKKDALIQYRKAFELSWQREKPRDHLFYASITEETINYMLPLLDMKKDAAEIARLNSIKRELQRKGRAVTPIVIPLEANADLSELVNVNAAVPFDLDGSGVKRPWGWITPKAGWLVYDRGGRDAITSGLQMVGGVTFWIFWQNGYHALAALDDNGNGILRANELKGLAIWQDSNANGISEPGEVRPVREWGIIELSCAYTTHATGIPYSAQGVRLADGGIRPSFDWIARSPSHIEKK